MHIRPLVHKESFHTLPPSIQPAGFVPGPTTRGTISLITSCLSTIFTCAYVAVHIDVLDSDSKPRPGIFSLMKRRKGGDLLIAIRRATNPKRTPVVQRVLWMIMGIFAPEFLVSIAAKEFVKAVYDRKHMQKMGYSGWTMTHSFFANMGGFKFAESTEKPILSGSPEFYERLSRRTHEIPLNLYALQMEINDRSKSNTLLKAFTILQALSVFVETAMRTVETRSTSPLEVATCAYILCFVFMYICWFYKPLGVQRPMCLEHFLDTDVLTCSQIHDLSSGPSMPANFLGGSSAGLVAERNLVHGSYDRNKINRKSTIGMPLSFFVILEFSYQTRPY